MREKVTALFKVAILLGALAAVVVGTIPKGASASEAEPYCPGSGCLCHEDGAKKWYESCGETLQ